MKLSTIIAGLILTFAFTINSVQAQTKMESSPEVTSALLDQYRQEVKQLRLEVLRQGIEFQAWKIQSIERELQQAQQAGGELESHEQQLRQQLASLNTQAAAASEAQEIDESAGLKESLNNTELKEIARRQQPIAARETELLERLSAEKQRWQELQAKLKKLEAERQ